MEIDASTKLIEQMITSIYDLVNLEPNEKVREKVPGAEEVGGRFKENNTKVHMCLPGIPLYPEDFRNMYTLGNPLGVKSRTALFSVLVDSIPAANTNRYKQTPRRVSNAFIAVVQAANSHGPKMSEETKKMLDKINKFLFCEVKVVEAPDPFAEEEEKPKITTKIDKTTAYKRYEELTEGINEATQEMLHVAAQASGKADWQKEYSSEQLAAMSEQQKNDAADRALRQSEDYWEDKSFGPRKTYEKLKREFDSDVNVKYVKQALDFQATHGNELTTALLANCKKLAELGDFRDQVLTAPIKLSLPSSTNFAKEGGEEGYTHIVCNTKDYEKKQHKVDVSADLGLKGMIKLVTFGLDGGGKTHIDSSETKSKSMSVEFDVCFVSIIRPWMDATLFSEHIQWDAGRDQKKGSVSSGKKEEQTDDNLLPFIPMQMIVAKNVKLKADWSDEHKRLIEQAAKGGFSIGWGPFKIAPSMKESSSHLKEDKKTGEGYLDCPGIQCIGFVSWVPPFSAPEDGESQSPEIDRNLVNGNDNVAKDAAKLEEQLSLPPDKREARYQ